MSAMLIRIFFMVMVIPPNVWCNKMGQLKKMSELS